jgi:predicted metal-dependent hydrolase
MNAKRIRLGKLSVDVIRKDIKNVHLSVYPPTGKVRISAPERMSLDTIRVFAISKLSWIKKQQNKFLNQNREASRDYISRESHYYMGKRYLLKVVEQDVPAKVLLKHSTLELYVRPKTSKIKRQEILENWYRQRLKEFVPELISKYEKLMRVDVSDFGIKKMRTKWGTCNREAKRIWLNLELAKKEKHFTEYIIAHEMTHLLERHHNDRFVAMMDKLIPHWRIYKEELNRLPLGHVRWND